MNFFKFSCINITNVEKFLNEFRDNFKRNQAAVMTMALFLGI